MKSGTSEFKPLRSVFTGSQPSLMLAVIVLVFISLVAATVAAALFIRSNSESASQRNIDEAMDVALDSIKIELSESISQLQAIQGLFNASDFVTREEFGIFVGRFLAETNGIQALEWIPRVRASQKEQFIDSVRKEGFEEQKIIELGALNRLFQQHMTDMDQAETEQQVTLRKLGNLILKSVEDRHRDGQLPKSLPTL